MRTLILVAVISSKAAADPRPMELRAGLTLSHTSEERSWNLYLPEISATGPGIELDVGWFAARKIVIGGHLGWSSFKTDYHDDLSTPHDTRTRWQHIRLHGMIERHFDRGWVGLGLGVDGLHESSIVSDGAVNSSETSWWPGANLQLGINVLRFDGGTVAVVADAALFPLFDVLDRIDYGSTWTVTTLSLGVVFRQL